MRDFWEFALRRGRACGRSGPADYDVAEPGFKLRMTDVAAAIGVHQLPRLEGSLVRREALARRYDALLADLALELAPPLPDHARRGRLLYTVKIGPARRHATR